MISQWTRTRGRERDGKGNKNNNNKKRFLKGGETKKNNRVTRWSGKDRWIKEKIDFERMWGQGGDDLVKKKKRKTEMSSGLAGR